MWAMSNLVLVPLEMVLVSVQDRCTFCAKRTLGLGIILDAPVLLGDEALVELISEPLDYNVNLDAR
jgi:hypothetical protein